MQLTKLSSQRTGTKPAEMRTRLRSLSKSSQYVDKAAEFIKKQSVYDGVIVNTSEYI